MSRLELQDTNSFPGHVLGRSTFTDLALPPLIMITAVMGGVFVAWQDTGAYLTFLVVADSLLIWAAITAIRKTRDPFNPLVVLLVFAAIRLLTPAALRTTELGLHAQPVFAIMGLRQEDWRTAHALTVLTLTAAAFGWFLGTRRLLPEFFPRNVSVSAAAVRNLAGAGIAIGAVSLTLFVSLNSDINSVLTTGAFRGTEIAQGTGPLFQLSLAMIAGAVVLSDFRSAKSYSAVIVLLPALTVALLYFVLGGRARTMTPIAAGLLIVWYARGFRGGSVSRSWLWRIPLLGFTGAWLLYVGGLYRASLLTVQTAFSGSGFVRYIADALIMDIGQLHGIAGAVKVGPAEIGPMYAIDPLLWPLSKYILIGQGNFEKLQGIVKFRSHGHSWGFHTAFPGQMYLSFGTIGAVLGGLFFGLALAVLYKGFRAGKVHSVIYALVFVYAIRIFFEGIEKWSELVTVVTIALAILSAPAVFANARIRVASNVFSTMRER